MKKIISLSLALSIVISLCSCDSGSQSRSSGNDSDVVSSVSSSDVTDKSENKLQEPEKDIGPYEITYSNARVYTDSIGTKWVQSIVEITNTGNDNLYLNSGSYDLEDSNGSLVAAQTMVSAFPDVLAPGEKGYMYEETTLDDYDGDGELTILPRPDVKKATVDLVRYNISDLKVSNDKYSGVKVSGRIENQTSEATDGMVYIVAFFYDANGTPIGSAFTILMEDIDAGAKIGFDFSGFSLPDDVTADTISDTIVYAYPLQYQF